MRDVQLALEPSSGRFEAHDDNWLMQVAALVSDLRSEVGEVTVDRRPKPGSKGTIDSIALSLASAETLTAVVELLRSWLGRDRSRSMKVSWGPGRAVQSVELSGSGLDDAAFDDLVRAVSRQVTGSG